MPEPFVTRMNKLLGDEAERFWQSFQESRHYGLRVNTLKTSVPDFLNKTPFVLEAIDWCPTGFYYPATDRPGRHPHHQAGVYYLQEPSAMAVAELASPAQGDKVLDLCAAPGGKATHLATLLAGSGLLVANEVQGNRAQILSENLERWGVKNVLVTQASAEQLVERFPAFFDVVVLDAPCSGEGMFRKDPDAIAYWSENLVRSSAETQAMLLDAAYQLLAPGGRLVYSTCTFAEEENERNVAALLSRYPTLELQPAEYLQAFAPSIGQGTLEPLPGVARLWPHRLRGEGHFLACFRKALSDAQDKPQRQRVQSTYASPDAEVVEFCQDTLNLMPPGPFLRFGDMVYQAPGELPDLRGLRVVRAGWQLGEVRKGRFVPSHSLVLALKAPEIKRVHDLAANDPQVLDYLRGHTLSCELPNGWAAVAVDGYPLGWGKVVNGQLKNHYPKGLRIPMKGEYDWKW